MSGIIATLLGSAIGFGVGAGLGTASQPLFNLSNQELNKVLPVTKPTPAELVNMRLRNIIDETTFFNEMLTWGYDREHAERITQLSQQIISVSEAVVLFRRGLLGVTADQNRKEFINVMLKNGVQASEIEKIVAATENIGSVQDVIVWLVREVFDPEKRKSLGLDAEFPDAAIIEGRKRGIPDDVMRNYWAAHWDLPSPTQIYEFIRRLHPDVLKDKLEKGEITTNEAKQLEFTEKDADDLLKIADFLAIHRPRLLAVSFNPLTRVDLRRMVRLKLIDWNEMVRRNRELGFSPADAVKQAEFNFQFEVLEELQRDISEGLRSIDDVRAELQSLKIPNEIIDRMLSRIDTTIKPKRTKRERDITKSEILKGLKKGIIDNITAEELLIGLGYDKNEAQFIIAVNIVETKGDPETPLEARRLVELAKKASGQKHVEITDADIKVEKEVIELRKKLKDAQERKIPDTDIIRIKSDLVVKESQLRQILQRLNKQ